MIKGIDVSYHNGTIDWNKVKASGIEFAIIRAGYGTKTVDKQFINNICGADTAGLSIGIYWFIYAKDVAEAIKNAEMCDNTIRMYKEIIKLNVWADWEYDSDKKNPQTKEGRTAIVKAFCQRLKELGYSVGVYANPDYHMTKFGDLSEYPLWLAKYSYDKGDYKPYMWQYSSKGTIAGIKGNVDMNEFYGILTKVLPVIKKGSKGDDVKKAQALLNKAGANLKEDGIFGALTQQATIEFQGSHSLVKDGIIGKNTWAELLKYK